MVKLVPDDRQQELHALAAAIKEQAFGFIVDDINSQERSQQATLGPSELGCQRCVGRHFAGIKKITHGQVDDMYSAPWLPYIGTKMHAAFEDLYEADNQRRIANGEPIRWLVEERVPVDVINGRYISGSCDLYDLELHIVKDHKLVGATTLKQVRRNNHPGKTYEAQAHIYGRGQELLGRTPKYVAILFYPRNAIKLSEGYVWVDHYNRELADKVVQRTKDIAALMGAAQPEEVNNLLVTLEADPGCFSCNEYPSLEQGDQPYRSELFAQPSSQFTI